jgi:uncharacterized membrane protein YbaN (DUF454 family)
MGLCFLSRITHWFVFLFGWLSFLLGVVGVVLPVLPTTPFMLLSAACFAKTSPRFHRWLLETRVFGELIRNWQRERYIAPASKRNALVIIAVTFGISIYVVDYLALKIFLVTCWLVCTFSVGRLSTVPLSERLKS